MIVMEYDAHFTQLSRYALNMMLTKQKRIKRFIKGLIKPLFRVLATQRFAFYATVVDATRMTKTKRMESRMERDRA